MLLRWVVVLTLCASVKCSHETVKIGGLFDSVIEEYNAFQHAVDILNKQEMFYGTKLEAVAQNVPADDEFLVSQTVCDLFSKGVVAIFGPSNGSSADHVQSMCDTKEVPNLQTRWDVTHSRETCMINLYPYPPTLARTFIDIINEWKWKSFTILYENKFSLAHISEILKLTDYHKGIIITIRELERGDYDVNYRPTLTAAKKAGETHFLLECSIDRLDDILKQAQQVGLVSDRHHYIIMNPDMHTIDMEPYQHGGSNITGIRFVDPDSDEVAHLMVALQNRTEEEDDEMVEGDVQLRLQAALVYDAVHLFTNALGQLSKSKNVRAKELYCNDTDNWEHGYSLINYMKMYTLKGLTGEIKFDHQGFRSDFMLDIIELTPDGLTKVGTWNSTNGINITRPPPAKVYEDNDSLHNKSFIVITSLTDPYGMRKRTSLKLTGNDRFEGFGIDLIHELSQMLGFNYTFRLQEDSVYGSLNRKTGQWNGMIKELIEFRADLAITDFTVTSERESGVDFTMPFMNLGISILYKKPMKVPPKLFSFTSPFSYSVWVYLAGAYFFVAFMLYVLGRLSPAEWTNPYPCMEEPEFLHNQFSLKNCLWFAVGSLLQQGSEIAPIAISTRMVAGLWWFFTLIMVSSYTANLAAFLTVESLYSPIKNIEDLANQNVIKYGAKKGGATANFFRDSNYSVYQKIWEYMDANEADVMTDTNPIGVERADTSNYAFLMESTSIEYTIERHCNLTQVGGLLDNKGYGIAMRKNSTYRNTLSAAVVKLQESGRLAILKNKWWKEKHGGGACTDDAKSDGAAELNLANVGGVFVVLVVGAFGGILVATGEMLLGVFRRSYKSKVSFKEELITELKFVVSCKGQTKPVTCRKSVSPEESHHSIENFSAAPYGYVPEVRKASNQQC